MRRWPRDGSRRSTARRARSPLVRGGGPGSCLAVILGEQEDRAAAGRGSRVPRERREEVVGRVVEDDLGRVESQSVEVELVDPVAGIRDEELADACRSSARRS